MLNNYKTIKLEKGMYKDKEKSFSEILEELDPTENYEGTSLSNLDAFQRQLKRFNIRVNGKNSHTVSKFWSTSDAQVLFPEYVQRSINCGIEESTNLKNIVANTIKINHLNYKNIFINQPISEPNEIKEGDQIPEVKIGLKDNEVHLKKIGTMLTCSYETMQYQQIATFSTALKQIGKKFNSLIFKDAIKTIIEGDGNKNNATEIKLDDTIKYKDLINVWTKLKPYNLTTLIVSPGSMQKILTVPEFLKPQTGLNFQSTGTFCNPLGANVVCSTYLKDSQIIAMDKNFTINHIISQYLNIESDKIIDRQLNKSVITMRYAFAKLFKEAAILITCSK